MTDTAVQPYRLTDTNRLVADFKQPYILRVRDMDDRDKPRERLVTLGPRNLSLTELLAVVLGVGSRREDVMTMSDRVLKEYGEKALATVNDPNVLADVLDIPLNKACRIVASLELGRRYYAEDAGKPVFVRTAAQAYKYLRDMGHLKKEYFRGLYLNSRYEVVRDEVVSVGSLTANIIHPREVFLPALENGAVAVILAHNHPSGSLRPSLADLEVTEQLSAAGLLLGIDLLDHLIITTKTFCSIKQEESK